MVKEPRVQSFEVQKTLSSIYDYDSSSRHIARNCLRVFLLLNLLRSTNR